MKKERNGGVEKVSEADRIEEASLERVVADAERGG
jgi:hypothetical protein